VCANPLPASPRGRLRWALSEALVVAGIFLFWVGVAALLVVAMSLLTATIELLQIRQLRLLHAFLDRTDFVWAAVLPLSLATTTLYVLVRTGTVLVEQYQRGAD